MTHGGGQPSLSLKDRRAISDRLKWFYKWEMVLQSQAKLAEKLRVEFSTVRHWFGRNPTVPSTPHLVQLAKTCNLNVAWLLLGTGAPRADAPLSPDQTKTAFMAFVRQYASHDLQVMAGASKEQAERLADLFLTSDMALRHPVEAVYRAALSTWLKQLATPAPTQYDEQVRTIREALNMSQEGASKSVLPAPPQD